MPAVSGKLNLVPEGNALAALAEDNANMLADQVMLGDALTLEQFCRLVEKSKSRRIAPPFRRPQPFSLCEVSDLGFTKYQARTQPIRLQIPSRMPSEIETAKTALA